MKRWDGHVNPHKQRGAAGLMAAVFLIVIVLLLGQMTLRLASTSVNDSLLTHDAVGALFLAESGLERAAAQLSAASATCDATLAGNWAYAGGTITIADLGAGFATDFDGTALSADRCRVRVSGSTGLFGAQRTVEGIVNTSGNLLGSANADFNAPPGTCVTPCTPTGWSLSAWDDDGGPDGSRAAYVSKPNGPLAFTSAGQFTMTAFTVTAPATLTLTFDYRMDCAIAAGGQVIELVTRLISDTTTYTASSFSSQRTSAFQTGTVTFTISGSGPVTITGFSFELTVRGGQPKQAWLDNLVLAGGGAGTASIERWREIIQ